MKKNLYFLVILISSFLCSAVTFGQAGKVLDFDGADDRVNLPFVISGNYTKEAWINSNNLGNFNNIISGDVTALYINDSILSAGHAFPYTEVQDTVKLLQNTWYHVAVTYNAATQEMRLYRNGIFVDSALGVVSYTETNLYLGAFAGSGGASAFSGQMDEVRIWNYVRTDAEIAGSANCSISGNEPGLLAYYNFDQGTAGGSNPTETTLLDRRNRCVGNDGTLINFALTGATSNWQQPGPGLSACSDTSANIKITGNSVCIAHGDNTPSLADHTAFGNFITAPITRTYTINNTGGGTLVIDSVKITGPDSLDFVISVAPSGSVAGNSSTTFNVTFSTNGPLGLKSAVVNVYSQDFDQSLYTYSVEANNFGPGKALNFDGTDDYVSLPFATTGSYTKEAWINYNNQFAYNNIISGSQTALYINNGASQLSAGNASPWTTVQDPTPLVMNTWYHVAVTYNDTTGMMSLYKNGVLVAGPTAAGGYTESNLYIGAFAFGGPPAFNFSGLIDEVRIWNIARNGGDIAASYNCQLTGDEFGLMAYYKATNGAAGLNNSGITNLPDLSDKCTTYDGTLNNFALNGISSNWVSDTTALSGTCAGTYPNARVSGNSLCILPGDNTPSVADFTDFGTYNGPGIDRVFVIANTGSATLNIDSITFRGNDSTSFSVLVAPASTVATGSTTTFTVRFVGTAPDGFKITDLYLYNNDEDESPYIYRLRGNFQQALPVSLQTFTGRINGSAVQLDWRTSGELNNRGFEILRSPNGNTDWVSIGFVQSLTGTINNYRFTDRSPMTGINTYRLKQVDNNGSYRLSQVLTFNFSGKGDGISLYPNPVKDRVALVIGDNKLLNTDARITTVTGSLVTLVRISNIRQELDLTNLAPGVYFISFSNGTVSRIVKQ